MKMSTAIEDYALSSMIEGLSPQTISVYKFALGVFARYIGDQEVEDITKDDIKNFLGYLRTDYKPRRPNGRDDPLSTGSIHRYWKSLRSFFKWCEAEHGIARPEADIKMPSFTNREVKPLQEDEIKAMLKACDKYEVGTSDRGTYKVKRHTAQRDKAIILFLLDTGVRAGELCRMKIQDINFENGEVEIKPHHVRKTRPRTVHLGRAARRELWRYLRDQENRQPYDPVFLTQEEQMLTPGSLRALVRRIGRRAGVDNVHTHRFRHTFAIQFLKNDGDVFSLKRLLGHSTLEMVNHYLEISTADTRAAHKKASPADRWRL